jgi:competence ComEA-like helix-hairpin-helix protein
MRRWLILLLPAAAAVALLWKLGLLPGFRPEPPELRLASWNIRIFSTRSRTNAELARIADRLQPYDLVAIQDLRDEEVIDRTLQLLADRGHRFRAVISPPVGRGVKERYAFLYRPAKVQVLGPERLYPDPDDAFIREPFWASFRSGQFDFTLVTIHSIFGDSKRERRAEALRLDDIYQLVQRADPDEQDVMILGDFNLPPDDSGFAELAELLTPLFTGEIRTTISDASLYDNIWFDPAYVREWTGERGVDRFDETAFGNDDEVASRAVSDHRPIWATFRTDQNDDGSGVATAAAETTWRKVKEEGAGARLNLNTASREELEALPGVGATLAGRIVKGRLYRSVEDLLRVKGIGEKTLEGIWALVVVE